jgi:uncharacterized protein YjbI with pentapeptide repeats
MDSPELQTILRDHETWLTSDSKRGARAELAGADLRKAELGGTNLRKANLSNANLSGADLFETSLRDADLQGADLADAKGLCSHQVSGANLSGARLSESVAISEGLAQVLELAKNAGRTLVFLIGACVYSWLTIGTTTDGKLLTTFVSSPLPVIGASIPLYLFYLVVPVILLALYLYLHLQLLDLWQEVAALPAVFPDGRAISQKIHPWLLAVLIRSFARAHHWDRSPRFLARAISLVLTWWIAPLTLAVFWQRYIPRHDLIGSILQVALIGLGSFLGVWSHQRTLEILSHGRRHFSFTAALVAGTIVFAGGLTVSYGAIGGINEWAEASRTPAGSASRSAILRPLRTAIPSVLDALGERAFADMKDAAVSERPSDWSVAPAPQITSRVGDLPLARETPADDVLRGVVGANLQGKDLKYANARGAFLARADLSNANLRGADLSYAYLQQADLENAHLMMAYLSRARMNKADMKAADLEDAYLGEAQLQHADLRSARLTGALLVDTDLRDANLSFAQLDGAILSNANLANAVLFGAALQGANLEFAHNLTQAQISDAFTDCSTILPAEITRPQRCPAPPALAATADARCKAPGGALPEMHYGVYTITLKSDASTCAVFVDAPGVPKKETFRALDKAPANANELPFRPALVGRFYTFTPTPPGSPYGTQVLNIPPGDGRSGFFRLTFIAPDGFSSARLTGKANVDDTGRVFLNGRPISPSIFSHNALVEFGNVSFSANGPAFFKPGAVNEILVSDVNTGAGPSGAAFYFTITFRK